MFQHTAARRRLDIASCNNCFLCIVSTLSRPKAAGSGILSEVDFVIDVSTLSRPKAAGEPFSCNFSQIGFQHSAPRRRLGPFTRSIQSDCVFQHSAARRRLDKLTKAEQRLAAFQHSAARRRLVLVDIFQPTILSFGFNTQPPEGGCRPKTRQRRQLQCFNTQPPEGGCRVVKIFLHLKLVSTLSRPKAAVVNGIPELKIEHVSTLSRPKAADCQSV